MSQIFDDQGKVVPVTLVKAGPCQVIQVKEEKKDGYKAVQIGFEEIKDKKVKQAQKGHFKKAQTKNYRYLKEFKDSDLKVGDQIKVNIFKRGEEVKVSGISKGKGFQGVVKRHGFKGMPATHGTKHHERAPGSIGSAFPERVFKGKKMAGRMGSDRITTQSLQIAEIDLENNILAIQGALPGKKGTLLEIIVTKELAEVKEEEKKQKEEEAKVEAKAKEKEKEEKKEEKKEELKKEEPKQGQKQ